MLFFRGQKIKNITKIGLETIVCNILGFIFYVVSRTKTDLHNKYVFNFVFGSFFEQDHLLNLFILRVYAKRWPKCARISKQKLRTIHWGKKYWGTRLVSEKNGSFVYAELNKTVEVATRSYSTTCKFLRYIYSALKAKNYQNIRSRCLVHQFSFPDFL